MLRGKGGSCRRWILAAVVIGGLPACAAEVRQEGKPATRPHETAPTQKVTFVTEDNFVIAGGYTAAPEKKGEKAPVVILLHMYKSDRSAFEPLVPYLHKAGFATLAIDLRGHGESVGPEELGLARRVAGRDPNLFRAMHKDVLAAYGWLALQDKIDLSRLALVGASVGCSVAMDYASRDRSVDAVACMTPGTSYLGIDSVADVKKLAGRPLLLLASEEERSACDELAGLTDKATVKIVGRAEEAMALHGTRMFGKAADVEGTIVRFLKEAVGEASKESVVGSMIGKVYYESDSSQVVRLSKVNLRRFSSAAEAEARGYRPAKSGSRGGRADDSSKRKGEAFPE